MRSDTTRLDICLQALDDFLGQRFIPTEKKIEGLREIEKSAKRMADGIERRERALAPKYL